MKEFRVASGSIIGSVHQKMCYNNQDHYIVEQNDACIIGLVADGCGSGANSEVGSKLTLRFIVDYVLNNLEENKDWKDNLEDRIISFLKDMLGNLKIREREDFITNHFMFTILGFIIHKGELTLFHAGDGTYGLNSKLNIIDQKNRPKYIAYGIDDSNVAYLNFKTFPLSEISNFLIATDGIDDLLEKGIGLDHLLDEKFFANEVKLNSYLHSQMLEGVLRDDTTVVVLKRFDNVKI